MKEMLRAGYWVWGVPRGYEIVKKGKANEYFNPSKYPSDDQRYLDVS